MKLLKKLSEYFSAFEIVLWFISFLLIFLSFILFDRANYITLTASLIGITSILLNAKGNPFGQVLMILFSLLYGIISYSFVYYGEMVTYLGMTMPMAILALISWLKNPYKKGRSEVAVNRLYGTEYLFMCLLTCIVTILFYFILRHFHTMNLVPSTLSVTTSFIAVYLTFRRSPYFSMAYAANDIVLIVLWTMAGMQNPKYISVIVCFLAFLMNDLYAFISWKRMEKRQQS